MQLRALLVLAILAAAAIVVTAPSPAGAERPPPGSYEGKALDRALAELELAIDPAPEGKVLDRIWVINLDVFGPGDNFLQAFNIFHRTTRWRAIEREVILRPGEVWDETKVIQTERKLRDPIFSSLVVIVPVKTAKEGHVDLLAVTRDVWSLRMNSNFEVQSQKLTRLTLSISENNFLGKRKQIALVFNMDQSNFFVGPLYVDKNVMGKRWRFVANAGPLFGRESRELEGSRSSVTLSKPFWSLDSKWGGALQFSHYDGIVRSFDGIEVRTYDMPETMDVIEEVPYIFDRRNVELQGSLTRSFGKRVVQRVSVGYELETDRWSLPDDFDQPDDVRDAFIEDVFPRSERSSSIFSVYSLFTPRYVSYRNINSFDLSEDYTLGPAVSLTGGAAMKAIGSENDFLFGAAGASYRFDLLRDGFVRVGADVNTRVDSGDLIDNRVDAGIRVVTPQIAKLGRVVAHAQLSARVREKQNRFLSLGGSNGLRGYSIAQFIGQRRFVANVEARTIGTKIWFTRLGGVLFYDTGHAADRMSELGLRHNVGLGARLLIPQLAPLVYRLDWALPLTGNSAGFPGRLIISFGQAF